MKRVHPGAAPLVLATLLVAILAAPQARGAFIDQSLSFNLSLPLVPGSPTIGSPLIFDAFDPALGILESVTVSLDGATTTAGTLPLSVTADPSGVVVPVPYVYDIAVRQDFPELRFLNTPEVRYVGSVTSTTAIPFASVANFNHSIVLDATTDLAGLATVGSASVVAQPLNLGGTVISIPPGVAFLTRQDFIGAVPGVTLPLLQFPTLSYTAAAPVASGVLTGTVSSQGRMRIRYTFEPAVNVPGPGTLGLVLAGLALPGLGSALRRA